MVVRFPVFAIVVIALSACTVFRTEQVTKIALLAPFEGQYREVGYNALYAARLAIADSDTSNIDLLAVDDGGSIETARLRIEAINNDPAIALVIVSGQYAASEQAQSALENVPMLIVGHWNSSPVSDSVYMLSNPEIDNQVDFSGEVTALIDIAEPIQGSEILALEQVSLLTDVSLLQIYSSASLPDANFQELYLDSAEFAPEPNLLATLTYDATQIALQSIQTNTPIADIRYEGINDLIQFEDGYWHDAPLNQYQYSGTNLTLVE